MQFVIDKSDTFNTRESFATPYILKIYPLKEMLVFKLRMVVIAENFPGLVSLCYLFESKLTTYPLDQKEGRQFEIIDHFTLGMLVVSIHHFHLH